MDEIVVRTERVGDHAGVRAVTIAAFSASEHGHNGEADLVDALREAGADCLSLVACLDGVVVGHVVFSPAEILAEGSRQLGMGLGPISVSPGHQRRGIGSRLIHEGLTLLSDSHCRFVVVLGHPDYYQRFGFRPASDFGVVHGFAGVPQELFFVRPNPIGHASSLAGRAYYHHEFGPQFERA